MKYITAVIVPIGPSLTDPLEFKKLSFITFDGREISLAKLNWRNRFAVWILRHAARKIDKQLNSASY